MDHLKKFKQTLNLGAFLAIFLPGCVALGVYIWLDNYLGIDLLPALAVVASVYLSCVILAQYLLMSVSLKPLEMVWQGLWHVSPNKSKVPAPKLESIKTGRELVSAMVMQIYDLASTKPLLEAENEKPRGPISTQDNLLENLPVPVFILNKDWMIQAVNTAACEYLELPREKIAGKSMYDVLHLSFKTSDTLDSWLKKSSDTRATGNHSWEHVMITVDGKKNKQFDLAASYSRDNPAGHEAVLTLFDRSGAYSVQEQATSYVALAVHELRTPLTMLRGYIELFEDELGDQLSADHKEFMRKMSASAQNLTAFVSNILNVARIDENQFVLQLHEADWGEVLDEIVKSLELRAGVKGKRLSLEIQPDLPTVGIDKISMYEVVGNLVDNAIKYSGQDTDIKISTRIGTNGNVETVVEDHGPGIPDNVISGLFTKFYRSHRSKNAVGGSGLGLYLVKSIVTAHGGNVWVESREGEGSKFGFSLVPYSNLNDEAKTNNPGGIERQAGGWIKNHSLYRR